MVMLEQLMQQMVTERCEMFMSEMKFDLLMSLYLMPKITKMEVLQWDGTISIPVFFIIHVTCRTGSPTPAVPGARH